jgi:hypothetical protein
MAKRTLNVFTIAAILMLLFAFNTIKAEAVSYPNSHETLNEVCFARHSFMLSASNHLKSTTTNNKKIIDIPYISHYASGKTSSVAGWHELKTNPGIDNLINLITNDAFVVFDRIVSTQAVSQIRIHLGDSDAVLVDSVDYPMLEPTAPSTGLKLPKHTLMALDSANVLVLDLDHEQHVNHLGNGEIKPVPVIRAFINP